MKIIFLDIDGVLVTWGSLGRWEKSGPSKSRDCAMMDPKCVAILNEVLAETKTQIVVSSSWRIGRTKEQIIETLQEAGVISPPVIDMTPRRHDGKRGLEIQEWLNHQAYASIRTIEKFVILDDEISDMDPYKDLVVQTSMKKGLTGVHKSMILKMLN